MDKVVGLDKMAEEIVSMMKSYTDDVEEAIDNEIIDLCKDGAKELQGITQPPASEGGTANPMTRREWKNYAKSWTMKVESKSNYTSGTIYNKKHYQLTHLLEFGHSTVNGKRTRAFKHIGQVSEKLEEKLLKNTQKIIEKGGKI